MFNADPDRPIKEILEDIQAGSVGASNSRANLIGNILSPFAALLVRLSRDAEASAQRMELLTKRLYVLTILILVLTLLLLIREIAKDAFEFYEKRYPQYQSEQQPKQNPGVNNEQKAGEPIAPVHSPVASPAVITPVQKEKD